MNKINTHPYLEKIDKIYIDNREKNRIDYALKQYKEFSPKVTQLDSGDYIFQKHDEKVVFEYKTGHDFISSLQSTHLHNQVYHMCTTFKYVFIIIECADLMKTIDEIYYSTGRTISLPQINGAIAEYSTNCTVLFVQTQYQAFDLMMRIAGKIFDDAPIKYNFYKKSTNPALNYLTSIHGLGGKAVEICKTFHMRSLQDVLDLTEEDLMCIEGIGKKKARKILAQIK